MLALRFEHFGPPSELQLQQLPLPVLMPEKGFINKTLSSLESSSTTIVPKATQH